MAGQKRSSISSDSDLSHYHYNESEISLESGLDQEAVARIEIIAKQRGVSPQNLISEILLEHLSKFDSQGQDFKKSRTSSSSVPLRFIDPADQISLDEDFRELAS